MEFVLGTENGILLCFDAEDIFSAGEKGFVFTRKGSPCEADFFKVWSMERFKKDVLPKLSISDIAERFEKDAVPKLRLPDDGGGFCAVLGDDDKDILLGILRQNDNEQGK